MAKSEARRQLEMGVMILGGGLFVLAILLDFGNMFAGTPQIPNGSELPMFSVELRQTLLLLGLIVWTAYAIISVGMGPEEDQTAGTFD